MSWDEVRAYFGDPTGYFRSEAFPAYLIHIANERNQASWQIVFSMDENGKIKTVFVKIDWTEFAPIIEEALLPEKIEP